MDQFLGGTEEAFLVYTTDFIGTTVGLVVSYLALLVRGM